MNVLRMVASGRRWRILSSKRHSVRCVYPRFMVRNRRSEGNVASACQNTCRDAPAGHRHRGKAGLIIEGYKYSTRSQSSGGRFCPQPRQELRQSLPQPEVSTIFRAILCHQDGLTDPTLPQPSGLSKDRLDTTTLETTTHCWDDTKCAEVISPHDFDIRCVPRRGLDTGVVFLIQIDVIAEIGTLR